MRKLLFFLCLLVPLCLPSTLVLGERSQTTPRNAQNGVDAFQNYKGIQSTLDQWARQSNGLAQVFTYGTSTRGQTLTGIHLKGRGPSVLIHGAIHGNEPLSTTVIMSYTQKLISLYQTDKQIKDLIDSRDIYIVPVLCPDSYPNSRFSDGVDPNRNFNGTSVTSISAIKKFFLEKKPKACWSGHTYGRLFMYPYGDSIARCPDDAKMLNLYQRMGKLANYQVLRGCQMYGHPIFGSEIDFYYRNGGSISCVVEYGTNQRIPRLQETEYELNRTWSAFLLWIKEAPILLEEKKETPPQSVLKYGFAPL